MALSVTGGRLKRRKLFIPKGGNVRPTSGMVREALFNILSDRVDGSVVLDLFAGSGALGIEALSRGASKAVFVESCRDSILAIRRNIEALGLEERSTLLMRDASRSLEFLRATGMVFDIVFMDPPYKTDKLLATLKSLASCGALRPGTIVAAEQPIKPPVSVEEIERMGFVHTDRRRYGKTAVYIFRYMV